MELIHALAQKSYNQKVLKLAEKRILMINKFLKEYEDDEIEKIYPELYEVAIRLREIFQEFMIRFGNNDFY